MKRVAVLIAIACGIASALLCWEVLGLIPHIPDELSYLYQGRILASGHLSVREPDVPQAFTIAWDHIHRESARWRAIYPPGWPLLLAIGWWIHAPWLINPLLLSAAVIGLFFLAKQLFDERTAIFAVIVFACSPFVLLMGSGFMAHPSTLCFAIWCSFFVARGEGKDYLLGGGCGAFAFVIRPYTAVALLLPIVLWGIAKTPNRKTAAIQLAAGASPFVILFAAYNAVQFGSLFRTGYAYDPAASFRGSPLGHFATNFSWYFGALNRSLWDFPWPDLLIFVPLLFPHGKRKLDALLFFCFLSLAVAYSVFYYRDIVYGGPRYVYEAVPFLAILAARSILQMDVVLGRFISAKPGVLMLFFFLYPLAITLPCLMEYHEQAYHGQSRELIDLVDSREIGSNALILVSGDPNVFRTFFLENDLNPAESGRVYVRDILEQRHSILRAYGRAEIWSMRIELNMLRGENPYEDRAEIKAVEFNRLR